MEDLFFKDWESLVRIFVGAFLGYLALFLFIRISGKRTLAKLSAFDFVVTVSLGSTLSWMILAQISLAEGSLALIVIIALQYILAVASKKSRQMEKLINSTPSLLFYNGLFFEEEMQREMITENEIYAEVRRFGIENISDVRAVVLELNGEMTVIKKSDSQGKSSLDPISIPKNN